MPIRRIEHVDLPFAERRHTPNYGPLAAMYTRMGEALADLAIRRGAITGQGFDRLMAIYNNFATDRRERDVLTAAAARREREREDDKAFARESATAERTERAAERKAAAEARAEAADRAAAHFAFAETEPGPTNRVTADLLRRFPETAGIIRDAETLPATVTPGAVGAVAAEPTLYPVKEPTSDQAERSRARLAAEAAQRAAAARAATDDQRMASQVAETQRHNRAVEAIQRSNAAARPDNTQTFVIRNGRVVPITRGGAQPGDVPYSAEAMQGMGGESSDARAMRTAAALNSLDELKKLAPVRATGPRGMLEGAWRAAKGVAGLDPQAETFRRLLGAAAMQMAVAVQGAAGLSNAEREVMRGLLGDIHKTDYETQMALLEKASEMIRPGADVDYVTVKDPKTGEAVQRWTPKRSRMPGAVTIGQPGAGTGAADPLGIRPPG